MGSYRPSMSFADKSNKARGYVQCTGETRWGRCYVDVSTKQEEYSKRVLGKVLCWGCQQKVGDKHE